MTSQPNPAFDFDELLMAMVEGELSLEQQQHLAALLRDNPQLQEKYLDYLLLDALLRWEQPEGRSVSLPQSAATLEETSGSGARRLAHRSLAHRWGPVAHRWGHWAGRAAGAMAAAVLFAALGAWLFAGRSPAPIATLTDVQECRWDGGTIPTASGAQLTSGRLSLAEGLARITFASGADVRAEGPADFELVSSMRCVLHSGSLTASVPPGATGFVVETPSSVVTDYGTEFGVIVRRAAEADVHVFQGRVDVLHKSSGQTEQMKSGASLRFAPSGVAPFDLDSDSPVRDREPAPPPEAGTRLVQLSTAQGRGRDAFVQPQESVATPSETLLFVKRSVPGAARWERRAYLGFDLSALGDVRIAEAELSVTFAPTGLGFAALVPDATFGVYGVVDESLDDWEERDLRWETAPAKGPLDRPLDPAKVVSLGSFVVPQGCQSGSFAVGGPALTDFLSHDTNRLATIVVVRETAGVGGGSLVHGIASRRHPDLSPPTLRLKVAERSK